MSVGVSALGIRLWAEHLVHRCVCLVHRCLVHRCVCLVHWCLVQRCLVQRRNDVVIFPDVVDTVLLALRGIFTTIVAANVLVTMIPIVHGDNRRIGQGMVSHLVLPPCSSPLVTIMIHLVLPGLLRDRYLIRLEDLMLASQKGLS